MMKLLRGHVFHAPVDPFSQDGRAETGEMAAVADGALAVDAGRVIEVGDLAALRRRWPDAPVEGDAGDLLLPGFVDGHVHYPQLPVIGAMGLRLLEWLEQRTLPEEARFADAGYARERARAFLRALARNGTTTALVFGAHFRGAMDVFFDEAERSGLRIAAGLVVSDRNLRSELHTTPERAFSESLELIERWHGRGRLRYAVTPRFSLSCSDAVLASCRELLGTRDDLLFTSHINETRAEIAAVAELFPDARDYLATYERHGLVGPRSVFAHNVHPAADELARLGAAGAGICHCPGSNAFIGSGLFPMRRHLAAGVRLCLGSDVGGGPGFSILKEGLLAYEHQMLHPDGVPLTALHLLWLATNAGAAALGLAGEIGDFAPGKGADAVRIRPPDDSTLAEVLRHSPSAEAALAAVFTLAREDAVAATYVAGERVDGRGGAA